MSSTLQKTKKPTHGKLYVLASVCLWRASSSRKSGNYDDLALVESRKGNMSEEYPMIEDLPEREVNILKSVTESNLVVEVLSAWVDDNAECIGVKINGVEVSFWWVTFEAAAAFYYLDSPTARKMVLSVLGERLQELER
jgi:hypothetical protein